MYTAKPSPPSNDKRWRIVEAAMRRNGNQGHALIETLHSMQEAFGYLEPEGLRYVAQSLGAPALLAAMEHKYDIKLGETTPDGELALLTARCVGSCSIAPVAVFDKDVAGKLTPADMAWRAGECCKHVA